MQSKITNDESFIFRMKRLGITVALYWLSLGPLVLITKYQLRYFICKNDLVNVAWAFLF